MDDSPKIRTWGMLCPAQPHYSPEISEISTSHSSQFRNTQQDWDRSAADRKKDHFTEAVPIYKSCKSGPDPQLRALQSRDVLESLIHVQ